MNKTTLMGVPYDFTEVKSALPAQGRVMPLDDDKEMARMEALIKHHRREEHANEVQVVPRSAVQHLRERDAEMQAPIHRRIVAVETRRQIAIDNSRADAPVHQVSPVMLTQPKPNKADALLSLDGGVITYDLWPVARR